MSEQETLEKGFEEAIAVIEAYSSCIRMLIRNGLGSYSAGEPNSADIWLRKYTVRKLKKN